MNRVLYFSRNDFACAFNLEKIETIDVLKLSDIGINDAIEFLEINKYFEEKIYLKKWSEIEIRNYEEKANQIKTIALKYLSKLGDKLVDELLQIESLYIDRFWIYFEKYTLYQKIDETIFNQMFSSA